MTVRALSLLLALLASASGLAQEKPPEPTPPPEVGVDEGKEPSQSPPPDSFELPFVQAEAPAAPVDSSRFARDPAEAAGLSNDVLVPFYGDPAYDYSREVKPRVSLLDRFFEWLGRQLSRGSGSTLNQDVVQWVIIAIAAGLLGWALVILIQRGGIGLFKRRQTKAPEEAVGDLLLEGDDLAEVDLAGALKAATAEARWRDAVRLQYLLALQRLADEGRITWSPDATNREYVRALRGTTVAAPFRAVTRAFEYAWYGDFPIDEARYAAVSADFDRLDGALAERAPAPREVPA